MSTGHVFAGLLIVQLLSSRQRRMLLQSSVVSWLGSSVRPWCYLKLRRRRQETHFLMAAVVKGWQAPQSLFLRCLVPNALKRNKRLIWTLHLWIEEISIVSVSSRGQNALRIIHISADKQEKAQQRKQVKVDCCCLHENKSFQRWILLFRLVLVSSPGAHLPCCSAAHCQEVRYDCIFTYWSRPAGLHCLVLIPHAVHEAWNWSLQWISAAACFYLSWKRLCSAQPCTDSLLTWSFTDDFSRLSPAHLTKQQFSFLWEAPLTQRTFCCARHRLLI